ncbi:MAG: UDP-2,3-diacylglucosamine diphosphatase LpxI [Pararhodobacter sp.]|nr:UDP-2,3-diacylglucosamine diphosphatase LpxI [Pararhodobacter sp.]
MSRRAIIAGSGRLPAELATELAATQGEPAMICALEGVAPDGLAVDLAFRVERLMPFMRHLLDAGVTSVTFAGPVHRMALDPALFDRETASVIPRLLAAMQGGDDATLRAVMALFEEFGLQVEGLATLAPGLLAAEGVLAARAPDATESADAARGIEILHALSPVDVGQGCVVASRLCLGLEALYGTDAMLSQIAASRDMREPRKGGVFVKRAKAGQDLRVDLPAIGPATIEAARAARLTGICLQAGYVVVLERSETLARAEAAGIALWAVP